MHCNISAALQGEKLTALSAYRPQPGSGESPTRPGALKGFPDVETP